MNHPIKFRVWDVKNKKFLPESYFAILGNGKLIVTLSGYYNDFTNTNQDDYVVQQYTRLTDNNDNPIYEGDILTECIDNETKLGICKQILGGWKKFTYSNSSICWNGCKDKVIGNIFEHPELLK
jgi:uncharacterized phage protein (TIGR01671 family)